MKKKWKIILLILLVVILLRCVFTFSYFKYHKNNDINISEKVSVEKVYELGNLDDYYLVKTLINRYYEYIQTINGEDEQLRQENILRLYDILSEEYKEENNITLENLNTKVDATIKNTQRNIDFIRYIKKNNIWVYFVESNIRNIETNEYTYNDFIIVRDEKNTTFSIYPNNYVKEHKLDKVKTGKTISYAFPDEIKENNTNKYVKRQISLDEFISDKYEEFRQYILYNPQKAYALINNKQFKNYKAFEKFREENYRDLFSISFKAFKQKSENGINIALCTDNYLKFEVKIFVYDYNDIKFEINKI